MRRFLKANKAATAIEFGIIAPVFFFLLLGIIEIGLTMFYESSLNSGLRAAARQGVPNGWSSPDDVVEIIEGHTGGLYDPSRATIIYLTYSNFDDPQMTADRTAFINSPSAFFQSKSSYTTLPPLKGPGSTGQAGHIVLYGLKYKWDGLTNMFSAFLPDDLYAFAIVRNEEF